MKNTQQGTGIVRYVIDNLDRLAKQFGDKYIALEHRDVRRAIVVDSDNNWGKLLRRTINYDHLFIGKIEQFTRKPAKNIFTEVKEMEAVA